jgi:fatty-acyl-CoA synthase
VRLKRAIATTATFKMKKADLQREGFDPSTTEDPIYVRHPEHDAYVRVDDELYRRIAGGQLRL